MRICCCADAASHEKKPCPDQVHPYIRFAPEDPKMARIIEGLIRRLAFYILYDPYANAFRIDTSYVFSENQKLMGRLKCPHYSGNLTWQHL